MLINSGHYVDGAASKVGDPYIQLLPLADPAETHRDFVRVRMGGIDRYADLKLRPMLMDTSDDDDDSTIIESGDNIKR